MTQQDLLKISKPILFNTPMTRAILDDRKTATRRVIKNASPKWTFDCLCDDAAMTVIDRNGNEKAKEVDGLWATFYAPNEYIEFPMIKAKYQVGDILYVRETWCEVPYEYEYIPIDGGHITMPKIAYRADSKVDYTGIWRPSIHMPKEAARIFLRVTDVRVERLRDISIQDAKDEGIRVWSNGCIDGLAFGCYNGDECVNNVCARPIELFSELWNSTVKTAELPLYGWEANPWVWVYKFERVKVCA